MTHPDPTSTPLVRLRRLAGARRSLLLAEGILALVLALLGGVHLALPTLLDVLLRGHLSANALLLGLAIALQATEVASLWVERAMGRTLGVPETRTRRVTWLLLLLPGAMLVRRGLQALALVLGALLLLASLVGYVVLVVLLARPLRLSARLTTWLGRLVDAVDRVLSGGAHAAQRLARALLPSPVLHPDRDPDLLVALLRRSGATPLPADARTAPRPSPSPR